MIRGLVDDVDNGIGCFTVAEEGGRVVSSLCLMRETFLLEGTPIPVGRPEFVATATDYEHRGLVRAQMELVHEWSAARGDLVQVVTGIPYFYRRFGYEYAIAMRRTRLINPGVKLEMPEGWSVRHARAEDVDCIVSLVEWIYAEVPLRAVRSRRWWDWWTTTDNGGGCYVAEREGRVAGRAFIGKGPPGLDEHVTAVSELIADDEYAVRALLAEAAGLPDAKPIAIEERVGLAHIADGISHRHPRKYALYARVADPVALLDHLRPVLTARLKRSHHASSTGSLLVSTYSSSLIVEYAKGEAVAIERGGPQQDPLGHGGIGVPPDLIATLIFGRHGSLELADRHPDVRLGAFADLAEVLFPRTDADLLMSL